MPPKEDPAAEIIAIVRAALDANHIDKASWGTILSRRDVGKIKRRLEKLEPQPMEVK